VVSEAITAHDVELRNGRYFCVILHKAVAFDSQLNYVKLTEDRLMASATKIYLKDCSFGIT